MSALFLTSSKNITLFEDKIISIIVFLMLMWWLKMFVEMKSIESFINKKQINWWFILGLDKDKTMIQ